MMVDGECFVACIVWFFWQEICVASRWARRSDLELCLET